MARLGCPVCTMGIQGYCMAVALLQTKSRMVSLAAQVDVNLLKENLRFHFAMLESCKGVMNISSSLPGLRCCLAGGTGEGEVISCGQHCSSHCSFPQWPLKFNENERSPEKGSVWTKPHPTFVGVISLKRKMEIILFWLPGLADKPIKPYEPACSLGKS